MRSPKTWKRKKYKILVHSHTSQGCSHHLPTSTLKLWIKVIVEYCVSGFWTCMMPHLIRSRASYSFRCGYAMCAPQSVQCGKCHMTGADMIEKLGCIDADLACHFRIWIIMYVCVRTVTKHEIIQVYAVESKPAMTDWKSTTELVMHMTASRLNTSE